MLTVLPEEEFLQLCEGVDEASTRHFNWTTMLKWSDNRKRINQYMATTDTKIIGSGSSRTAYYLPQGKYGPNKLETPACFKVANNGAGVAQNKLEISNLKQFGSDQWPCFPYLYNYDSSKGLFMLCEVGTPVYQARRIEGNYFDQWRDYSMQYSKAHGGKNLKQSFDKYFGKFVADDLFLPYDMHDFIPTFGYRLESLEKIKNARRPDAKEVYEYTMGFINTIGTKFPKYNGIATTMKFCMEHPGQISASDFEASDNWAFVKRGRNFVAIPIDWGLNQKVWDKHYRRRR
jgi:hypothetical protein